MSCKATMRGGRLLLTACVGGLIALGAQAETIDSTQFLYRAPVTFPGYNLDTALENFPVLVRLTAVEDGFSYDDSSEKGADIRFALEDGTLLPSEVALWNAECESQISVSVPHLEQDGTSSKVLTYWGGTHEFPASQTDGTVWSKAGYFGVWHMDEASGAEKAKDSAGGAMEGTYTVTATGQDGIAGRSVRISDGGYNVADKKGITTAPYSNVGSKFAFTLWTKYPNQKAGTDRLGSTKEDWQATSGWEISTDRYNAPTIDVRGSGKTNPRPNVPFTNTGWRYLTFVFNDAQADIYIENEWKARGAVDSVVDSAFRFVIGNSSNLGADSFKGWMDEVRLYKGVPSRDWISTEYNTVKDTEFAAIGKRKSLATEDPVMGDLTTTAVEMHAATLAWTLNSAGASPTTMTLKYGTETGVYTETVTLAEELTERTSDTVELTNLHCGTTYYAQVVADNGSVQVVSAEVSFPTPGAPEFSNVSFVIVDGMATASATLTSGAGTADVTAKCVFANRIGEPVDLETWTVTESPATLTATKSGVDAGHYLAHFEVSSTCPVCNGTSSASSEEVEAEVAGTYEWTGNAADGNWNTPGNWSMGDVPTAVDTVVFGNSVTDGLVVTLPEDGSAAAKLIRVTSANPLTIGTRDGAALPAASIEIAEGAGLVTINADFDFSSDVTVTLAKDTELDFRRVKGTKNLVIDGEGTVKMLKNDGARTDGQTEVKGGLLLISASKQLGHRLYIGGADKPAIARSNGAYLARPFGDYAGQTFVLDKGVFDLETDGMKDHWQKEMNGAISVAKGGTFLPGGRRVQLSTGGVPVLTIEGAIEGGTGTFNFPDSSSLVVPETAETAPVITSGMTVTQNVRFNIADIPSEAIDATISGGIGFGWAWRDAFWKMGAGVLRLTGKNTYGGGGTIANGEGTTQLREGTLLVDNDSTVYGSGTGNSLVRVNGGTVLGGTGRIGGLTEEVKTWSGTGNGSNTRVTVKGSATAQAVVWPGTINAETGAHVNGTLTVGIDEILPGEEVLRTLHHPVTFGDYSTLKIGFGAGKNQCDALVVNGAVDISATGTKIELVASDASGKVRGGTYTILSATDGITGDFAQVDAQSKGWKVNKVMGKVTTEEGEADAVVALTATIPGSFMVIIR